RSTLGGSPTRYTRGIATAASLRRTAFIIHSVSLAHESREGTVRAVCAARTVNRVEARAAQAAQAAQAAHGRLASEASLGMNSFQRPSETTSTVPSITLMAVSSSIAYAGPEMSAAHLSAAAMV